MQVQIPAGFQCITYIHLMHFGHLQARGSVTHSISCYKYPFFPALTS